MRWVYLLSVPIGEWHFRWRPYARYALALVLVLVALGARFLMNPLIDATTGNLAFITLYPAALLAFYLCGTGPALVAMSLSGLAGEYLFRPPIMGFSNSPASYLSLGFFYFNMALIGLGIAVIRDQAARIRQSYARLSEKESQLTHSLEAMTRLHRLGQMPIWPGHLESFFTQVVETAVAITAADFGNIQLLQPESKDLRIACQIGFPNWWVEFWDTVSRGQGVCGTALEHGERVIVEDVEQSAIFQGTPALDVQLQAGVRAVQSTPLFSRQGQPLGMFSTHYRTRRSFDPRELQLLDFLAHQAADIIERAHAEEVLRQSKDDLSRAQLVGQIGSWRLDLGKNILTWSDENYRIFGVPIGTAMSYDSFLEIVHPEDREYVEARWCAALKGEPYDIEHRILVDGCVKWVKEKAFLEFDSGGALSSGFGITQDITERKLVELERLRLASIVERSPDFIGISDLSGKPSFLNQAGRRMVGLDGDFDVSLTEIREYFVREERNFVDRVVLPAVLSEGRWCGDLTFRHWLTDAPIPVLYEVFRIDDPQTRKPLYFATVTRDMTERKQGEHALRASEQRFRAVYEHAAIGIAIGDPEGHLLECNPAFQTLLGYTPEELRQQTSSDLVHPDDRATDRFQIRCLRAQALPSFETESRYIRKDGRVVWVHKFVSLLRDSAERPIRLVILVTDITARRQLEETLRDADRRKDEFLATLAHELRNPLAPIRSGVSALRKTHAWSETTEALLEMMERQMIHVVRLVDDLMDVSRITLGKIELRKERTDLVGVVEEVAAAFRSSIAAEHHSLNVSLPAEPAWVDADRVRIAQVLDNLLSNAIKYMDPGGSIRMTLERQDHEALITVHDSGVGIPADALPHVFDPFTQFHQGSAKVQGGLGLGLSLVRRLVEMHGGQVAAISDGLGQGSEFSIRLPLAPAPSEPESPANLLPARSFPRRVMIVDDNRDVADSLAVSLKFLDIDVLVEYDGLAALNALDAFQPEVILLDLGMPGMDGCSVARCIRQRVDGSSFRLIALTGWGQEQDQRRSREAGFDHHLIKPVDLDLLETILVVPEVRTAETK
ncbi:PAS domain S-box protein [Methylolobus aquaticus]|nr:PAS domain S-box protein [Methylolobus aquaticus]